MRKVIVGLVGVIVLVIIAIVLIAPRFIGPRVEHQFRQSVTNMANTTGLPLQVTEYHRHWFDADAVVVLNETDTTVTFDFHLIHGPIWRLRLATVHGHPADVDPQFKALFAPGQPLRMTILVPFSGKTTIKLQSDKAKGTIVDDQGRKSHLVWGGATANINLQKGIRLSVPHLNIDDDEGQLEVKGLTLDSTGPLNWQHLPNTRKQWNSRMKLHVKHLSFDSPKGHLSTAATATGTSKAPEDGTLDLAARLKFSDVRFEKKTDDKVTLNFPALTLEYSINGLKRRPVEQMLQRIRQLRPAIESNSKDAAEMAAHKAGEAMLDYLPGILAGDPKFSLQLNAKSAKRGQANGVLKVGLEPGKTNSLAKRFQVGLLALMTRVAADAKLSVSKPLLELFANDANQKASLHRAIAGLAQKNILMVSDDKVETHVHYSKGKVKINGQPLPPRLQAALLYGLLHH